MDDLTHKNAIKNGDNTKCMRVTLVCKLVPIFFLCYIPTTSTQDVVQEQLKEWI